MSNSGRGGPYYWCLEHHRVETDENRCAGPKRLGPFATVGEAAHALDRLHERREVWETEKHRLDR